MAFWPHSWRNVIWIVLHEVFVESIDGVVGEVHAEVVDVALHGFLLLVSAESEEAVFVDPDAHGVNAGDQHLQPHVLLEAFNQGRFVELLLTHPLLVVREVDVLPISNDVDSFSLRLGLRFHNKLLLFTRLLLFIDVVFQIL